jgi:hypothetical protein
VSAAQMGTVSCEPPLARTKRRRLVTSTLTSINATDIVRREKRVPTRFTRGEQMSEFAAQSNDRYSIRSRSGHDDGRIRRELIDPVEILNVLDALAPIVGGARSSILKWHLASAERAIRGLRRVNSSTVDDRDAA